MFKYAAPSSYRGKRRGETPFVVSLDPAHARRWSPAPVTAPTLTRRMGHYWIRAWIRAGITGNVPQIHSWDTEVWAFRQNEQGGDWYKVLVHRRHTVSRGGRW